MGIKIIFAAFSTAIFLQGCAVSKDWSATGGSRADGIVKLSYQYRYDEKPILDELQAIDLAASRCKVWGYKSASAFGGAFRKCIAASYGSCDEWLVTKEYQCTGSNSPPAN